MEGLICPGAHSDDHLWVLEFHYIHFQYCLEILFRNTISTIELGNWQDQYHQNIIITISSLIELSNMQAAATQNTSTQSKQKSFQTLETNHTFWQHPERRRTKHQHKPNKTTANTVILVTTTNKQSVAYKQLKCLSINPDDLNTHIHCLDTTRQQHVISTKLQYRSHFKKSYL